MIRFQCDGCGRLKEDGEVWILRLISDCQKQSGTVATLPSPPATELKDQIWHAIATSLPK